MRRRHNESNSSSSSTTTTSRPILSAPQQAQFNRSTSYSSLDASSSSKKIRARHGTTPSADFDNNPVMIPPSSPCGTPHRKRWEGALSAFLRGKNPQHHHSPTLSSSPSSSIVSVQVAEDASTGTSASVSSGKGTKKKSSFSLIPGSKRLVSRNMMNKTSGLSSMFSKTSSSHGHGHGNGGRFNRGHKSMDELDVPLRKGLEKAKSNAIANSITNGNSLSASPNRHSSTRRRPPATHLPSSVPESTASDPLCGKQGEQEQLDNTTITTSTSMTPPTSITSALNDQLMASAISTPSSYPHPQAVSIDWHTNPIVNEGVELPLATTSAPSLTQLHPRGSQSRTYMYGSNTNTPVPQHQYQCYEDELDLRMMPELPSLQTTSGNHNRMISSLSDYHDVGLNLDDEDNSQMEYANQLQPYQLQSTNNNHNNNNSKNNNTIITDCGIPEPPESLDDILGDIGGMVTVQSSSSFQLLNYSQQSYNYSASPDTKKAFTKIHNSSEYGKDSISPFLGGHKASNLDLAGAHKSYVAAQQALLLHSNNNNNNNSNNNINGDGRTQYGYIPHPHCATTAISTEGEHIITEDSRNSSSSFLSKSLPLQTVVEQNSIKKGIRLLKPIQSAESWVKGRRYLIAPAALAACPLDTIKSLTGLSTQSATEAATSMDSPRASGMIELGEAFMTYVGDKYHLTCGKWSACRLVLRQNYLFEYDLSTPLTGLPRGIAHLQHAVAHTHQDFQDALELHFYASPCAKVDHRVLMIQLKNRDERDHWITCLNKAARLRIEDLWEINKDDLPLGSGRYASIVPARRKMSKTYNEEDRCDREALQKGNSNCALKIIDKNEFWRLVIKGRERCDTIVRELAVQSTLTAKFGTKPTFLQIHGFFETSEKVVIELELLDGKDLFEYISSKGVLKEEEAGFIVRDVLVALDCMNRVGIAHRDIKPANILMTCDESKYGASVKLGDFGMSTLVGVDGLVRGRCGSPGYVAPEILKAETGQGYGNQVDVFSTGVTLYLMLCGYEPFYGETEKELINANKQAKIDFPDSEWGRISPEAQDLVAQMLKTDPSERITAKEALEHAWIVRLEQDQKHYNDRHVENSYDELNNSAIEEGVCAIM